MSLGARYRQGDVGEAELRLLVHLGDAEAATVAGRPLPGKASLEAWVRGLAAWGRPALARACAGALRAGLRALEGADDEATARVLERLEAWLAAPGKPALGALQEACAQVPAPEGTGWPAVARTLAAASAQPLAAWRPGPAAGKAFAAAVQAAGGGHERRAQVTYALREGAGEALRTWALRSQHVERAEVGSEAHTLAQLRDRVRRGDRHVYVAACYGHALAHKALGRKEAAEVRRDNPWYRTPWPADREHLRACVERSERSSAAVAACAALVWAADVLGAGVEAPPRDAKALEGWLQGLELPDALEEVRAQACRTVGVATASLPKGGPSELGERSMASATALAAQRACGGEIADLLRAVQRALTEHWLEPGSPGA